MGKYSCKCMVPGCAHLFLVESDTVEEAIQKIMTLGDEHNYDLHPEMPILSDEKVKSLIAKRIEKVL